MTGPNRAVIKRRLGHAFAFVTRKPYLREIDQAEGPFGWMMCRGLHPSAQHYLPEYGCKFQVHVQTPFKKLNLYTATLTIVGDEEFLLQTKVCPTPNEALSNLRVMMIVSEDPIKKEKLANLQWDAMCIHHAGDE